MPTRPCSRALALGLALLAAATSSPLLAQTPVPSTLLQIRGTKNGDDGVTATYRAFRQPGAPYRILCIEPCTADLDAVYGLYAGFGQAYQQVVSLFGVAALPSEQPFDLHIDEDHWCGPAVPGIGGDSQEYAGYPYSGLTTGSWGCFWFTTPGHYALPFHYPETSTLPYQLLTAHEFTHTEFFSRHAYSYEDFAKAVSMYVSGTGMDPTPVTDACDEKLNRPVDGRLLWLLCHRSGFQYGDLAPAFTALDNLFLAGKGAAYQGTTSVYQLRQALGAQLGKDTLDAFLAGGAALVPQFGDDAAFPYLGGRVATLGGWASFLVSLDAVTSTTPFHLDGAYSLPTSPPGRFSFENAYQISVAGGLQLHFEDSVYLQVKYDPSLYDFGNTDESTLQFYVYNGTGFQPVAGSRVDPAKRTVSAAIPGVGTYVLAASTTPVAPALVIPRAISNASVHTRAVLRSASFYPIAGTLQLHPQGAPASPSDPTLAYSLAYNETMVLPDLVAAFGASGAGTVDVVSTSGPAPDVLASELGASGSGHPGAPVPVPPRAAALRAGEQAFLVAPSQPQQESFRFLVRTFSAGVTLSVVARNPAGAVLATTALSYPANTELLVLPRDFASGQPAVADESYELDVQAGSALILLDVTESGMAAHNYHLAERFDPEASAAGDALHFPKAIAATNPDGSLLRTSLQLTNPSAATITGRVRFKPTGGSTPVSFGYSLPAHATMAIADVVGALGRTGPGALEVISTAGNLPFALARLVHAGAGMPFQVALERPHDPMEILQAGDRVLLAAPVDTTSAFRIGVRTLARELALTITVNTADGYQLKRLSATIPAGTTEELDAASFLGIGLSGGETIELFVDGGGGLVYGAAVVPASGAVGYQGARRLPYY
jgi:hypothetical protein